jgi:hypothetical protein
MRGGVERFLKGIQATALVGTEEDFEKMAYNMPYIIYPIDSLL